jgi:hypothetical protein
MVIAEFAEISPIVEQQVLEPSCDANVNHYLPLEMM